MAYVKLTALLRIFYETGLQFLPVVEIGPSENSALLGFLSRRLIDIELADIERSQKEYDFIPDRLMIKDDLPEILLENVRSTGLIPVYNAHGQKTSNWDYTDLLKQWNHLKNSQYSVSKSAAEPALSEKSVPSSEPEDDGAWLAGQILSTMEFPLYVSDLKGNTLFYNGHFEERILNHQAFRKSVKLAETFFLEMNRSLLAQSFQQNGTGTSQNRMSWIESLNMMMEVKDLYTDDFLSGYVYSFHESGSPESIKEIQVWLESGRGLTDILEDIESQIIYSVLKRHGENISHAANALKMSRTTLQSRMKMLQLDERFSRTVDAPIRRIRKKQSGLKGKSEKPRKSTLPEKRQVLDSGSAVKKARKKT